MITVIFRYDDFSARSNTALEERLIALLAKHRVPCVIGVVPFVCAGDERDIEEQLHCELPGEKVALLREGVASGMIEPALHGYHHQNGNPDPDGRLREFAGLPFEEQLRRLQSGRAWLERICGTRVETFIPPFNAYDRQTLTALETAGFRTLSAAMFDEAAIETGLAMAPHTCSIVQLRDAIERVRRLPGSGHAVLPLFHPFDFVEADPTSGRIELAQFEELVVWLKTQPDVACTTLSALPKERFDAARFLTNRAYLRLALHQLALPWWPPRYPRTQYLPIRLAQAFCRRMRLSAGLAFCGLTGVFVLIGAALSHTWAAVPLRAGATLVLLAALLTCAVRRRTIYFRTFAVLLALSGIAAGSWLR